jgi:hypothetical protein|mmetsp:Transcript_16621/g.26879  ORF Transcript_16621/g.26879 Transcript_16621/m.26879 type:complete len:158 (+) Transcript_16621:1064-1537(+)
MFLPKPKVKQQPPLSLPRLLTLLMFTTIGDVVDAADEVVVEVVVGAVVVDAGAGVDALDVEVIVEVVVELEVDGVKLLSTGFLVSGFHGTGPSVRSGCLMSVLILDAGASTVALYTLPVSRVKLCRVSECSFCSSAADDTAPCCALVGVSHRSSGFA